MTRSLSLSGDLALPYVVVACALAALSLLLLALELRRRRREGAGAALIAATGVAAVIGLLAAVLRPVAVTSRGHLMGPRIVVLTDLSRSMDLPGAGGTRREAAARALKDLAAREGVRLSVFGFGDGPPVPDPSKSLPALRSDLGAALEAVARAPDERPAAVVVISDGRLDRPPAEGAAEATRAALEPLAVASDDPGDRPRLPPVHTVAVAAEPPPDAGVRAVRTAGAAVAHQPVSLRVEIACTGGLDCGDPIPVSARELREEGAPTPLASGEARLADGRAVVELPITLDRAGTRILEVQIKAPPGDKLPENDTRYVAVDVARDRIRVLHVAGRPTYDVRALRMWLKSDASVDVVAFFILRTPTDTVNALNDELALIPFPVDELFSVHLSSFDAVVLQDFDADPYGLTKHLPSLAQYVERGGGLIMVGGPNAFVPGGYGRSRLARVMPVSLNVGDSPGTDPTAFTPVLTPAGRTAPVLAPLLSLIGAELPEMPGTSVVGDAAPFASVLLTHPTRKTASGAPMPVLALGEHGSGRTIALTVDGSHRLLFSAFAQSSAGRAHGAFWDALLGWLMRDPRFEPAAVAPRGGCIAGEEAILTLRPAGAAKGAEVVVKIQRLGTGEVVRTLRAPVREDGEAIELAAGVFEPGGYMATVEVVGAPGTGAGTGTGTDPGTGTGTGAGTGAGTGTDPGTDPVAGAGSDTAAVGGRGPATRRDFACERGGEEWADPRPDLERLAAIAEATGGRAVTAADVGSLPLPEGTEVVAERQVKALAPPWLWTLAAAALLGAHWIVRRRAGLS